MRSGLVLALFVAGCGARPREEAQVAPSYPTRSQTSAASTPATPAASASADPLPSSQPIATTSPLESTAPASEGQELRSDLSIQEIAPGAGRQATKGNKLTVHYVGKLANGLEFDSSRKRGTPFTFELGAKHVIEGWDRGLVGMRVGGQRRLVIPPALGYGARGAPPNIPPNAVLVFDIELVAIE
ncbi:MAG: FKBP-type peptidyl-prolyl cis-trans isomerase [Polyangiaceae bacterium]|nr:FKBP-type peptidyl-prolyl cis-trans isomerase [Polyangiaceae bacterium]